MPWDRRDVSYLWAALLVFILGCGVGLLLCELQWQSWLRR